MKRYYALTLSGVAAVAVMAACSTDPVQNEDDSGNGNGGMTGMGGGVGTGTPTGTGTGTGSTTGTPTGGGTGTPTGSGNPCFQMADFQSCGACLAMANAAGAMAYNTHIATNCLCANECMAACTADCANPMAATPDCNMCVGMLGQTSACAMAFGAACMADAVCAPFAADLQGCPQT